MVVVLRWSDVLCCVGVVEFLWHGPAVSRRRTQCDGCAEDGGVVWRRGGIDGRPGKVNAMIPLGDGFEEDDSSDFCSVCNGVHSGFGGPDCVPNSMFGLLMSNKAPII
jgi:hypothetical protein